MGRKVTKDKKENRKPTKANAPDHLTMRLFAPGMTVLHRAGLGGLACTLRYIERAWEQGILIEDDVPGGPWTDDTPPWEIDEHSVTLRFGSPENAGEYLKRLFRIAFQTKDGLIYLPGQYGWEPSLAVRAALQNGMVNTLLQYGKHRDLIKHPELIQFDPNGTGYSLVSLQYERCSRFVHQSGWGALVEKTGMLRKKDVEIIGFLSPGAIVRHNAHSESRITNPSTHALPLFFAIVGCLSLSSPTGGGVLIVPDVTNLAVFCRDRQYLTPGSPKECRIAGLNDAAFQAMLRLRARGALEATELQRCYAMRFRAYSWDKRKQQKYRIDTSHILKSAIPRFEAEHRDIDELRLDIFSSAWAIFRPRTWIRDDSEHNAAAQSMSAVELLDSVVRPFIADNLAGERDWFDRFDVLIRDKRVSRRVSYEKQGLFAMTEKLADQGYEREAVLVKAVHNAISFNRRRIKLETQGGAEGASTDATLNRQERYMERVRLSLVNAKRAADAQSVICKLFRSTPYDNGLQKDAWAVVLPLLVDPAQWQRARNVALLALASWGGWSRESDSVDE